MVMPTRARDACPCPKSYGHGVQVSRPALVPLANLADCCIVGPHRAIGMHVTGRAIVCIAVGRLVCCPLVVGVGSTCWMSMSSGLILW